MKITRKLFYGVGSLMMAAGLAGALYDSSLKKKDAENFLTCNMVVGECNVLEGKLDDEKYSLIFLTDRECFKHCKSLYSDHAKLKEEFKDSSLVNIIEIDNMFDDGFFADYLDLKKSLGITGEVPCYVLVSPDRRVIAGNLGEVFYCPLDKGFRDYDGDGELTGYDSLIWFLRKNIPRFDIDKN